jgi:WD40 repeat protein
MDSGQTVVVQPRHRRKAHRELVCDILGKTPNGQIVTCSMDGQLVLCHHTSRVTRVLAGLATKRMLLVEHLGYLLTFGVDPHPQVWFYNVPGSVPMPLGGKTPGHPARILQMSLLEDDAHAVSVDRSGTIKVYDIVADACVQTMCATEGVECGQFLLFDSALFLAGRLQTIYVATRRKMFRMRFNQKAFGRVQPRAAQVPIVSVVYHAELRLLAVASGSTVALWNVISGELLHRIEPFGSLAAAAATTTVIPVEKPLVSEGVHPSLQHISAVTSLALDEDGRRLFVGGGKAHVAVLSFATGFRRALVHVPQLEVGPLFCSGSQLRGLAGTVHSGTTRAPLSIMTCGRSNPFVFVEQPPTEQSEPVVERMVFSTTSEWLRIRQCVHHAASDTLVCTEELAREWTGAHAVTLWRRLPNGSWARSHSELPLGENPEKGIGIAGVYPSPSADLVIVADTRHVLRLYRIVRHERKLQLLSTWANRTHRAAAGVTAVAFHPTVPRLVVVADEVGNVRWYDLGDVLHMVAPPPESESDASSDSGGDDAGTDADSAERFNANDLLSPMSCRTQDFASMTEAEMEELLAADGVAEEGEEPGCAGCGAAYERGHALLRNVCLLRELDAHGEAIVSMLYMDIDGVGQTLVTASTDGDVHFWSPYGVTHLTTLADTARLADRPIPPHPFAAASPAMPRACDLPAALRASPTCGEKLPLADVLDHYCTDDPQRAVFLGTSNIDDAPDDPSAAKSPAAVALTNDSVAFGTGGDAIFLTAVDQPDVLADLVPQQAPGELPPPTVAELGVAPTKTHALYDEWMYGQHLLLEADRGRPAKTTRLHDVFHSDAASTVNRLIREEPRYLGRLQASLRRQQTGEPLPDVRLRSLRIGVAMELPASQFGGDALLNMPPLSRSRLYAQERDMQRMKAQFEYKQHTRRKRGDVEREEMSLGGMPADRFRAQVAVNSRAAANAAKHQQGIIDDRALRAREHAMRRARSVPLIPPGMSVLDEVDNARRMPRSVGGSVSQKRALPRYGPSSRLPSLEANALPDISRMSMPATLHSQTL